MSRVSPEELWVLSYYRASELAGALFFGRLARRTTDDELRVQFTRHFADEARHAWLWTETIQKLGEVAQPVAETYQSEYAKELGLPASMADILLLTERFESRIYQHFLLHRERGAGDPLIDQTLSTMLEDEAGHLDWIERKLASLAAADDLAAARARLAETDERIYARLREREARVAGFLGWSDHPAESRR